MTCDKPKAPANHVESLRHRMNFDAYFACAINLQEAEWCAIVAEQNMCSILHDDDFVFVRKVDHSFVEVAGCNLPGRAIGIIDDKQLCFFANILGNVVEIWEEVIFGKQWKPMNFAPVIFGMGASNGVTRNRHQGDIAWIDENCW